MVSGGEMSDKFHFSAVRFVQGTKLAMVLSLDYHTQHSQLCS